VDHWNSNDHPRSRKTGSTTILALSSLQDIGLQNPKANYTLRGQGKTENDLIQHLVLVMT
jgi:hypothetical protein